jgi:hypothetical protein
MKLHNYDFLTSYTVVIGKMTVSDELGRQWQEAAMSNFGALSQRDLGFSWQ